MKQYLIIIAVAVAIAILFSFLTGIYPFSALYSMLEAKNLKFIWSGIAAAVIALVCLAVIRKK